MFRMIPAKPDFRIDSNLFYDGDCLTERIHSRLSLAHIGQGTCRNNKQLRVRDIRVIPGVHPGSAGEIFGGVEKIQRLRRGFLLVCIHVIDLLGKPL